MSPRAATSSSSGGNNNNNITSSTGRWCPTPEQLMILEELYRNGVRTPNASHIQRITSHLSLYGQIQGKNVFYWFQNHKARDRLKLRRKLEHHHHPHHLQLLPPENQSTNYNNNNNNNFLLNYFKYPYHNNYSTPPPKYDASPVSAALQHQYWPLPLGPPLQEAAGRLGGGAASQLNLMDKLKKQQSTWNVGDNHVESMSSTSVERRGGSDADDYFDDDIDDGVSIHNYCNITNKMIKSQPIKTLQLFPLTSSTNLQHKYGGCKN